MWPYLGYLNHFHWLEMSYSNVYKEQDFINCKIMACIYKIRKDILNQMVETFCTIYLSLSTLLPLFVEMSLEVEGW